jgi:hypothetical protein
MYINCVILQVIQKHKLSYVILKLFIPCVSDHCIRLLYRPKALCQIHINIDDKTLTNCSQKEYDPQERRCADIKTIYQR